MTMGEKISKLRRDRNMTQDTLASLIGVRYQAINKYEHGIVTNIPVERLERIAHALGTTTAYLLDDGLQTSVPEPCGLLSGDADSPSADEIKRRRICGIIAQALPSQLDTYLSVLSLPYEKLEAVAKLFDASGDNHGQA